MVVIELEFLSGRFHATPWGRNVNEGDVEWPPSPYRLARALIDVWKRRRPQWPEEKMRPILELLSVAPRIYLPPAAASHTRSYLSSNKVDFLNKQLIFDAFVVLDKGSKVYFEFDGKIEDGAASDLDDLLQELNYLGRSESWVRAKLVTGSPISRWNCTPSGPMETSYHSETVRVACLMEPSEYVALPKRPERMEFKRSRLVATNEACSWMEAVSLDTRRLLTEGWTSPPGLKWVNYERPANALKPTPRGRAYGRRKAIRSARYQLVSKVLPSVTETVPFAEKIRAHLMGIHKRLQDNDPSLVSRKFSGKDQGGGPLNGHQHAFYLPLDEDGDGRLDHLVVTTTEPFDKSEMQALDSLRSVWQSKGRPDVKLVLISTLEDAPRTWTKTWVSATPFVTGRHYRRGRGRFFDWLTGEVLKECTYHGLPEPAHIEWIPGTVHTAHSFHWLEFVRNRKGQKPLRGHGCAISFDEPVPGPFTLGAGCHFGLGLFVPLQKPVAGMREP